MIQRNSMIPNYSMIPSYLMIPSYSMINWKYGLWQSKSLRWYLHHWWSCCPGSHQQDEKHESILSPLEVLAQLAEESRRWKSVPCQPDAVRKRRRAIRPRAASGFLFARILSSIYSQTQGEGGGWCSLPSWGLQTGGQIRFKIWTTSVINSLYSFQFPLVWATCLVNWEVTKIFQKICFHGKSQTGMPMYMYISLHWYTLGNENSCMSDPSTK